MPQFLIRYGEIALKSKPVRDRFQKRLIDNIHDHFVARNLECRTAHDHGRIYLWCGDPTIAIQILKRVFGIVSFSQTIETTSDMGEICKATAEYSKQFFTNGASFAVRARRTGQHPYTSQELGREVGSAVWVANEDLGPSVNLNEPDIEIFVEVRQNKGYIFSEKIPGPGGMPLGSQGRIVGAIEKEEDIAAIWLMMKRGCKTHILAEDENSADALRKWDPRLRIEVVENLVFAAIAEQASIKRAEGIVVGWDAARIVAEKVKSHLPIFHPLIGLSEEEIKTLLAEIKS